MKRRLGGIGKKSLAGLASLSLAGVLAGGFAITGCSSDNGTTTDGGLDGGADTSVGDAAKADTSTADTGTKPGDAGGACATPTFTPGTGTVVAGTAVTINATGLPAGGLIYFTTDGTQPTTSSLALTPGGSIVVNQTEKVKAVAIDTGVCTTSAVAEADYTVLVPEAGPEAEAAAPLPPCPVPTLAPADGTALTSGQNVVITATGLPAGGYIFFTTDNTLATRTSPIYNDGTVGVAVSQAETIHAISSTLGTACIDSAEAVAHYTVTMPEGGPGTSPAAPTFSPTGTLTTQSDTFQVTLADATQAATICYTMGASGAVAAPACTTTGPTAVCSGGTLSYTAPIQITGPATTAGQVEIDAIACVPGATPSAVAKSLYTLQAATPTMSPVAGSYTYSPTLTGTFQSATSGATIFYTINGAAPSCTTPVAGQLTYAGAFPLQTGSYKAVACRTGFVPSSASTASAITVSLTAPIVTPAAGTYATAITPAVANSAANPTASWLCSTALAAGATTPVPACGAATSTCTTGTPGTTPPTLANGGSIQAIACAPAGLANSTVTAQGPYNLVLGTPIFAVNGGTPSALTSFTVPPTVTALAASEPTGNLAAGWFCFQKDAQLAAPVTCGATVNTCTTGTATVSGDLTTGGTAYGQGDSTTVVACPTAASGYAASAAATLNFIGTGTSGTPSIAPAAGAFTAIQTPVLANTTANTSTLCFTTDSTTPTCTAGSTATNCKTVDGVTNQAMTIQVTKAGTGYVNPPTAAMSGGGGSCTGTPVATLGAGGSIASIAVTGCSGYTSSPSVTLTPGSGATATAVATETISVAVTAGGSGYTSAPTVTLKVGSGSNLCTGGTTCTAVLGSGAKAGQVIGVTVTGWSGLHSAAPAVAFTGGAGSGAAATATTTQTVTDTVTAHGANYTVAPVVNLTGGGTGAACTSTVATLGTGGTAGQVATVTSTGCTGFTSNPTLTVVGQGPTFGSANAATAVGVASSMWALPAIQANTVITAVACGTGLATSANQQDAYTFNLAAPTIASTAGNTTTAISATNTVTIGTTSNFTGETLIYTTNGFTPACSGAGASPVNGAVTVTGNTVTLGPTQLPPNGGASITIKAIACGTNQASAGPTSVTFTGGARVAFPSIDSIAAAADVSNVDVNGNPIQTQGTLTVQNVVSATITNPTTSTGSFFCYTTNGTAPDCTCTTAGETKVTAATAAVNITTSGSALEAIACALDANGTTVDTSGISTVSYDLTITGPLLTASTTLACPASYTIGFNPAAETADGPTIGTVTTCYGLVQPTSCAGGTGITCVTTATAAVSYTGNTAVPFFITQCLAGFDTLQSTTTIGPLAAYTPPTVTVDGTLGAMEWTSNELAAGTVTGIQGGFTFGTNHIFTATGGLGPLGAGKSLVVYFASNKSVAGNTTTTSEVGSATLPFLAEYAVVVPLTAACTATGGGACVVTAFSNNGTTWSAIGTPTVTAAVSATAAEVDVATGGGTTFGDLAGATSVSAGGALVTSGALTSEWPAFSGAWGFFKDGLNSSCVTPAATVQ